MHREGSPMDLKLPLQLCFLLVLLVGSAKCALSRSYDNQVALSDKYTLHWAYNATEGVIYLASEVETTGWVALGFTEKESHSMDHYDDAIGMVVNGAGTLKDYLTNGYKVPPEDDQQDVVLTASSEEGGKTILEFHRLVDTGDTIGDIVIKSGEVIVVWAYRNKDELGYHDARGFKHHTLIP